MPLSFIKTMAAFREANDALNAKSNCLLFLA